MKIQIAFYRNNDDSSIRTAKIWHLLDSLQKFHDMCYSLLIEQSTLFIPKYNGGSFEIQISRTMLCIYKIRDIPNKVCIVIMHFDFELYISNLFDSSSAVKAYKNTLQYTLCIVPSKMTLYRVSNKTDNTVCIKMVFVFRVMSDE